MEALLRHLVILPIVLPMATGALLLLVPNRLRRLKMAIHAAATLLLIMVALTLINRVADGGAPGRGFVNTYPLGNWPVPFGIVLVADRLSALMVLLAAIIGACAGIYSFAR